MYSTLKSMLGLSESPTSAPEQAPPPKVEQARGNRAASAHLARFTHTVEPGQTLGVICDERGQPREAWKDLWELNKDLIPDPDVVPEGVVLTLPTSWVQRDPEPSPILDQAASQASAEGVSTSTDTEDGSSWSAWDLVEQGRESAGAWVDAGLSSAQGLASDAGRLISGEDPAAAGVAMAQTASAMAHSLAHSQLAERLSRGNADVYFSQRDNETQDTTSGGSIVHGDNMCTVTSLAMQIAAMAGGETFGRMAVVQMLEEDFGQVVEEPDRSEGQVEDLLWRRFDLWELEDWNRSVKENWDCRPQDFRQLTNMREWKTQGKFHQFAICQKIVLEEVAEHVGAMGEVEMLLSDISGDPKSFKEKLQGLLEAGGTARLGTKLTSGHIVVLKEVLEDGALLYDPYGCGLRAGQYLKNGSKAYELRDRFGGERDLLEKRWSRSPERLAELDEAPPATELHELGKGVFYSWDEVAAYKIGTSAVSVASTRDRGQA